MDIDEVLIFVIQGMCFGWLKQRLEINTASKNYLQQIKSKVTHADNSIYKFLTMGKKANEKKRFSSKSSYLPTPPLGQDMTHGQFLSGA